MVTSGSIPAVVPQKKAAKKILAAFLYPVYS